MYKCRWDDGEKKREKRRKSKELTVLNVFVQITNAVVPAFIYCDSVLCIFFWLLHETSNDILY